MLLPLTDLLAVDEGAVETAQIADAERPAD